MGIQETLFQKGYKVRENQENVLKTYCNDCSLLYFSSNNIVGNKHLYLSGLLLVFSCSVSNISVIGQEEKYHFHNHGLSWNYFLKTFCSSTFQVSLENHIV